MARSRGIHHDTYFRRQFSQIDFACSFFQNYLPKEIRDRVDWNTLKLSTGDFVTKALKRRRSDIVYEATINGRKTLFYIHLEHQRKQDPEMPFRMLVYTVAIWEQFRRQYPRKPLPLIYPMVIYQGRSKWTAPTTLHDMLNVPDYIKPYCPQMSFGLMDLTAFSDEEIRGELAVQIVLNIMKHIDSPDITDKFIQLIPVITGLLEKKPGLNISTICFII